MKKALLSLAICSLAAIACRKDMDRLPDPIRSDFYQVAEYHKTLYDNAFPSLPHFPFLFKKIYDTRGNVKEIDCSFWDVIYPNQLFLDRFYHTLSVDQKGQKVYLINTMTAKGGIPDTVATITTNGKGRAISCAANKELDQDLANRPTFTESYTYDHDRLSVIRTDFGCCYGPSYDTLHYDSYGNILAFGSNTYKYDYTKRPTQQFYCDDFQGGPEPFYLMLYLGYFPEISSPPNLRIFTQTLIFTDSLRNHRFDAQGRLIGYDFAASPVTITWK
jgi:hypothetical protein